jgi:hypothetical protein
MGSDASAEGDERDSEEEGIGQDISSDSNSYEPAPQQSDVVSPSAPQRLLQNSKGMSEFAFGTTLSSVSHGFHDKSAFERFERANRGTSSGSMTSEHVLNSSEVISSFLPTSDVLLADNKLTVEAKAAQSDIHDASSALKPNDSRTLKNTEVLPDNDSRLKAASSSSQGAPQRSSRPTAPQDVATPSPRRPGSWLWKMGLLPHCPKASKAKCYL